MDDYPELAMRTAAGPEVFHYPRNDDPGHQNKFEIDEQFIGDAIEYLTAAAKMDDWKSRLFYGKPKYRMEGDDDSVALLPDYDAIFQGEMALDFISNPQLIHAILGIATEGAEMVEDLLKLMRGRPSQTIGTDTEMTIVLNLTREGGDTFWFLELLATALGFPTAAMRDGNIKRLAKRYPDRFNERDAVARADEGK